MNLGKWKKGIRGKAFKARFSFHFHDVTGWWSGSSWISGKITWFATYIVLWDTKMNYVFHLPCLLRHRHMNRCFHVLASSDGGFRYFRPSFSFPVWRKNYTKEFNIVALRKHALMKQKKPRVSRKIFHDLFAFFPSDRANFRKKICVRVCMCEERLRK